MNRTDLARLNEADRLIQQIARELGLDFMPQEFDVVPAQKMLEIMAYRLPVNFSHWSFGRDYEAERTKFEHGYAVPYEVVFNSDPSRAYLMDTNPFCIQVLVMAHVYAHNDFMKNSRYFQNTRRDMIASASEAASRFRKYEEDYGAEAVERIIDAGMAIQWNIDPDQDTHRETEQAARDRLYGWSDEPAAGGGLFDDLLPPPGKFSPEDKKKLRKRTPPEPTVDLLGYILSHSPRPLKEWEKDILGTIQLQAQYFVPYRRTKVMNEGWATYWHEKIMQRLFAEKFLSPEEHGFYNLYNARVKSHHPRQLNPYLLGYAVFSSIEGRWNMGRFGPAYEECESAQEKARWDTGLGQGRQKIFEVRRTHMDWFFLHEFLTKEVIDELNLYIYREREKDEYYESVVEDVEWQTIKEALIQALMNWGVPRILAVDGNYLGSLQLYLKHSFEGLPLDDEYARKTMEHVYTLWDRPVYLETLEPHNNKTRTKLYTVDEEGIRIRVK
jgi:stage V sporulation protein R